jgi:hypothetical protein
VRINLLVEGDIDEAVGRRLLETTGHSAGIFYGKRGWLYIKNKIRGFNTVTKVQPIFALVDFMDTGENCPPRVVTAWVPNKSKNLIFRVVVREIESWLLADINGIAQFLRVPRTRIPSHPEKLNDPKQTLVNLAHKSRSRNIRSALVPKQKSTATEGKLYRSELIKFVYDNWDTNVARMRSPSLDHCLIRLQQFH